MGQVSMRIDDQIEKKVRGVAKDKGITITDFVENALQRELGHVRERDPQIAAIESAIRGVGEAQENIGMVLLSNLLVCRSALQKIVSVKPGAWAEVEDEATAALNSFLS